MQGKWNVLKDITSVLLQGYLLILMLMPATNHWLQPSQVKLVVPDGPEVSGMVVPDSPE